MLRFSLTFGTSASKPEHKHKQQHTQNTNRERRAKHCIIPARQNKLEPNGKMFSKKTRCVFCPLNTEPPPRKMIQPQSILRVADNSGAKTVKCIKILNKSKFAYIGDCILVSIKSLKLNAGLDRKNSNVRVPSGASTKGGALKKKATGKASGGSIRKGQIYKALIIRTKSGTKAASIQRIRGRSSGKRKMGITTCDGTTTTAKHGSLIFQTNDVVLIDSQNNPIGSRVFGPVTRDLRAKNCGKKIISQSKRML
uniref:50S ribosomal protein L14 n=1 Tax=Marophrys sp. SRT127 TaxID=2488311 RepID=A0A455REP3_9EUKA|nr:50S ribosomal protein L14 [Marophrys sp. SRT127]